MMILFPLNTYPEVWLLGRMVSGHLIFVGPSYWVTVFLMAVLVYIFHILCGDYHFLCIMNNTCYLSLKNSHSYGMW